MNSRNGSRAKARNAGKKDTAAQKLPVVRSMDEFRKLYLPKEVDKTVLEDLQPQEAGELFAKQSLSRVREILLG